MSNVVEQKSKALSELKKLAETDRMLVVRNPAAGVRGALIVEYHSRSLSNCVVPKEVMVLAQQAGTIEQIDVVDGDVRMWVETGLE